MARDVHERPLGQTGVSVSEIGFGAWGIGGGWGQTDDDESLDALRRALDLGISLIDTAWVYGEGRSERLIGHVLAERGDDTTFVATKIPPMDRQWPAQPGVRADQAFPASHVRARTEESLRRLGREQIDLQQFHVWSPGWLGDGDWASEIARLKEEGKIRFFGVSINDHEPGSAVELVRSGLVDTVQVIYNVFDQSPEDELFPACIEHGVGVLARVPLDEGALTGTITPDSTFDDGDWRASYFGGDRLRQVEEHVQALLDELGVDRPVLPEVALRYVLSHEAVSAVIPGMRKVRNVERNVAIGDGRGLPAAQVEALHRHRWIRNFYDDPED